MFWIKLLKFLFIVISAVVGFVAGEKLHIEFKDLKWYEKIARVYLAMCMTLLVVISFIALWQSL